MAALLEGDGWLVRHYKDWLPQAIVTGPYLRDCIRQYPIGLLLDPPRRFRCDFAFVAHRFIAEVMGGAHAKSQARVKHDVERTGLIVAAGWTVLTVTPEQVKDGEALRLVRAALGRGA